MNFSRHLLTAMLVALLSAMALSAASSIEPASAVAAGLPPAAAEAARGFSRTFLVVTAALAISFVAVALIEEKPLRAGAQELS